METFWIPGAVPSKKNGKMLTRGRIITDPVKQKQLAAMELLARSAWHKLGHWEPWTGADIGLTFHVKIRNKDLDNMTASVLDSLVKAGVLVNDSMAHVLAITANYVFASPSKGEGVMVAIAGHPSPKVLSKIPKKRKAA